MMHAVPGTDESPDSFAAAAAEATRTNDLPPPPCSAVAAWAAWLSWQRALPGDADSLVDRARVIELAAVLAVLPWLARRRRVRKTWDCWPSC
jgi:hypothetical protein